MSALGWCPKCNDFDYANTHKCLPVWDVWCIDDDDNPDDSMSVYALSARVAVELWAKRSDPEGDYWIIDGGEAVKVKVVPQHGDPCTAQTFTVSGQVVHNYTAEFVS